MWNAWRTQNPSKLLDLRGAMLSFANLEYADLQGIDFTDGYFEGTNLTGANLDDANLTHSALVLANLLKASLTRTNFSNVSLGDTVFADVDLSETVALNTCRHWTGSIIDFRTLTRSGKLPIPFLRGVGLPDDIINHFEPARYYSCFMSYSTKDQTFADQLYADLQNEGVRCWFAPHDLQIGAKIWDSIDKAIRRTDKLLLVLSKEAIASDWVEDEVNKAYAEERERKTIMLFPVRIDDTVMTAPAPWASKLRNRHIGDFRQWAKPQEYQNCLQRLLHDLKQPS